MDDAVKKVFKEVLAIQRTSVFDDTAQIEFYDEEKPLDLKIILTPTSGFYADSQIEFKMKIPQNYPQSKPSIQCITKLYHPNISLQGSICFSMMSESQVFNIEQYVNGLLWLIYNPNLSSRLNSSVDVSESKFQENVRNSIRGATINGVSYPRISTKELTVGESILLLMRRGARDKIKIKEFTVSELTEAYKNEIPPDDLKLLLHEIDPNSKIFLCKEYKVLKRMNYFQVEERLVCKEMVVKIEQEFCMILTNTQKQLDPEMISKSLNVPLESVNVVKAKEAQKDFPIRETNIFERKSCRKLFINSDVLEQEYVYTSFGKGFVIQINPKDILKIRPDSIIISECVKK